MNRPCDKTLKQIQAIMVNELGSHCFKRIDEEGDIIQFWNVDGHVIITHAYSGVNGWTYYQESPYGKLDEIAEQIRHTVKAD